MVVIIILNPGKMPVSGSVRPNFIDINKLVIAINSYIWSGCIFGVETVYGSGWKDY